MIIVEQAPKRQSIGARIAEHCQKYFFDYLDAPIETISSMDIPSPVSKTLETATAVSIESVKNKMVQAEREVDDEKNVLTSLKENIRQKVDILFFVYACAVIAHLFQQPPQ